MNYKKLSKIQDYNPDALIKDEFPRLMEIIEKSGKLKTPKGSIYKKPWHGEGRDYAYVFVSGNRIEVGESLNEVLGYIDDWYKYVEDSKIKDDNSLPSIDEILEDALAGPEISSWEGDINGYDVVVSAQFEDLLDIEDPDAYGTLHVLIDDKSEFYTEITDTNDDEIKDGVKKAIESKCGVVLS